MALLKPRRTTAAGRAARRANGRQSRGPKTPRGKRAVAMNALKHGQRSRTRVRPLWQPMTALGEDAGRYAALLEEVVSSYPPGNAMERAVCQEITQLRLKLERIQRAQEAKLVRTFERLEHSRLKQRREMESGAGYDGSQAEVRENGLLRAPDAPAKFNEVEACLERLEERVENGDFDDETELEALYGRTPTFRGAGIINAFRALSEDPEDRELRASLRMMVHEEIRDIAEGRQTYLAEQVEITPAMRLECLAPVADAEYSELQHQEVTLNQQLERKIKLLLAMQAARREQGRVQGDDRVEDAVREPLGWMERASDASKAQKNPDAVEGSEMAREVSLRHKLAKPRPAERAGDMTEVVRKIREIYGLPPVAPEPEAIRKVVAPPWASETRRGAAPNVSAGPEPSTAGSGTQPDASPGIGSAASATSAGTEGNGPNPRAPETTPPVGIGEEGKESGLMHDAPASKPQAPVPAPPTLTCAEYLQSRGRSSSGIPGNL
jgi:hypothetical protein